MNYSLILACDINGIISIDGKIPWMGKYPSDLKNFKALTTGKIIIMGSKTFESLPDRKLLPNRTNVVLSSRSDIRNEVILKGGHAYSNIPEMHKGIIEINPALSSSEIFVIGGIEIYKSMKHLISTHYITVILESFASISSLTYNDNKEEIKSQKYLSKFANNLNMDKMEFHIIPVINEDQQYMNLMKKIIHSDNFITPEKDRTEFGYYATYGEILKFDISNNKIPLTTLRGQPFRWIVEELLWFVKGQTDNKILKDKNVTIWNKNTSISSIKKRKLNYPEDIAGPIYGFQWRRWGANYNTNDDNKEIDQLVNVIKDLLNPLTRYSRRHIISGWNVSDLSAMVLPPCHVLYQFSIDSKNQIHTTFYQRSSDVALACSWNATSAAIFTNIIGILTGLKPTTLTMFIANAHIYTNHIDGVKKMLDRKSYEFPTISISGIIPIDNNIDSAENIDKKISAIIDLLESNQFKLNNYFAHPFVQFDMNA